jgi:hypothetical protein
MLHTASPLEVKSSLGCLLATYIKNMNLDSFQALFQALLQVRHIIPCLWGHDLYPTIHLRTLTVRNFLLRFRCDGT